MSTAAGKKTIKVVFVKPGGEKVTVDAKIGDSMLEVAHANKIDVEGACGGETACSTCHIILKPEVYSKLPPASEAEEDMLDLATGLTKTSRLGCQVRQHASIPFPTRAPAYELLSLLGDVVFCSSRCRFWLRRSSMAWRSRFHRLSPTGWAELQLCDGLSRSSAMS